MQRKQERLSFHKVVNSLTGSLPNVDGVPITFDNTSSELASENDAEWNEDSTLLASFQFYNVGTADRPRLVVNSLTVHHDDDNPSVLSVLDEKHPMHRAWASGIAAELLGLHGRDVMEAVTFASLTPEQQRMCLTSKIVLRAKRSPITGEVSRLKARLTAGGHRSKAGYHFQDSATPGASSTTPRVMATLAALTRQTISNFDVTQAYVSAPLLQGATIHIHFPPELQKLISGRDLTKEDRPYSRMSSPTMVLKLKKNLYGLKSGGVDYFTEFDSHMQDRQNMGSSYGDTNLYVGEFDPVTKNVHPPVSALDTPEERAARAAVHGAAPAALNLCAAWAYVDDGLLIGPRSWKNKFMSTLQERFDVDDAKPARDILNIRINQSLCESNKSKEGSSSRERKNNRGKTPVTVKLSQGVYSRAMLTAITGTVFSDELSSVPKRRTPIDQKLMNILDYRGISRTFYDRQIQLYGADVPPGIGAVSTLPGADDNLERSVELLPPDDAFENEPIVTSDASRDPTRWSKDRLVSTFDYRKLTAQILWLSRNTRPDLAVAASVLSRHVIDPHLFAYRALVQTLRYLASTLDLGLTYTSEGMNKPVFYTDADFTTGRPRCGYVAMLAGAAIDWNSSLSTTIALSTAEAELYAAIIAQKRALTLRKDLEAIGILTEGEAIDFRQDNAATFLLLSRRVTDYSRMRHIENGFLKCIEWQCRRRVAWKQEPTASMLGDFFTKVQPIAVFISQRNLIMNITEDDE